MIKFSIGDSNTLKGADHLKKLEIGRRLAKLLAEENIHVIYANVSTAKFNPTTRVLKLPNWDNVSKEVRCLLIAHEVGHALWTPAELPKDFSYGTVKFTFLNIVEDARIEKNVKTKYPGTKKDFFNGYKELVDLDFFGDISPENIACAKLIDRINLHFKIGHVPGVIVPFTDDEKAFLTKIEEAETFEDSLEIARELYELAKETKRKEEEEKKNNAPAPEPENEEIEDDELPEPKEDDSEPESGDSEDSEGEEGESEDSEGEEGEEGEPEGEGSEESSGVEDPDGLLDNEDDETPKPGSSESEEKEDSEDEESEEDDSESEGSGGAEEIEDSEEDSEEDSTAETDSESDDDGEESEDEDSGTASATGENDAEDDEIPEGEKDDDADRGGSMKGTDDDMSDLEDEGEETEEEGDSEEEGESEEDDIEPDAAETSDNFDSKLEDTINDDIPRLLYLPKMDYEKFMMGWKEFLKENEADINEYMARTNYNGDNLYVKRMKALDEELKPAISAMVREFTMKKESKVFVNSEASKRGSIDPTKLHAYRITDDIFKAKHVRISNDTNHRLVMVLDGSVSMSDKWTETIKQVLTLTGFCRQVGVPFSVFAFLDESVKFGKGAPSTIPFMKIMKDDPKPGVISFGDNAFSLVEILSSEMNAREYEKGRVNCLNNLELLGHTPLLTSLVSVIGLMNRKLADSDEKINLVVITDGQDNCSLDYYEDRDDHIINTLSFYGSSSRDVFVVDWARNVHHLIEKDVSPDDIKNKMIEIIVGSAKNLHSVTGYYVVKANQDNRKRGRSGRGRRRWYSYSSPGFDQSQFMREAREIGHDFTSGDVDGMWASLQHEGYVFLAPRGYDRFYMLNANMKKPDNYVGSNASKVTIQNNFAKKMAFKKSTRKLAEDFATIIA